MALILVAFFGMLLIGVPIAHVVAGSAFVGIMGGTAAASLLPQQLYLGMNSYVLLSVPFFIISGDIAARGNTSQKLINALNAWLGALPGGLGMATVFACTLFGAITGSSVACVVAIGSFMMPKLIEHGYPKMFVVGLLTCSATIGVMIPPSVVMLTSAVALQISVGRLFTAGFVPGVLTAVVFCIYIFFQAKKYKIPVAEKTGMKQKFKVLLDSFWALMFPVLVLGSIYSGLATPTEAAVISVFYVLFIELVIYRTMPLSQIMDSAIKGTVNAATLTLTIATAQMFIWYLTTQKIPDKLYAMITGTFDTSITFLLAMCLFFLIVGCFTNVGTAVIILGPMLLTSLAYYNIDPVHFGIVVVIMAQIGFVSPPFGLCLFVSMKMAKMDMIEVTKGAAPFLVLMAIIAIILVFVPILSTWLPDLVFGVSG